MRGICQESGKNTINLKKNWFFSWSIKKDFVSLHRETNKSVINN